MRITLHKNATTTPAIRAAIQRASGSDYELAREFRVTRETIRRWRKRDFVEDASHTARHLPTTLNAGQEELVIYLRTQLRLPLDDLLAVIREFTRALHEPIGLGSTLAAARSFAVASTREAGHAHPILYSLRAGLLSRGRQIPAADGRARLPAATRSWP